MAPDYSLQILQAQEGYFPPTPERESLFEPQTANDTTEHPHRPPIPDDDQVTTPLDNMTHVYIIHMH